MSYRTRLDTFSPGDENINVGFGGSCGWHLAHWCKRQLQQLVAAEQYDKVPFEPGSLESGADMCETERTRS